MLAGCTTPDSEPGMPTGGQPAQRVDFSGYWEKNYQASDDFNTEFNLFIADVRRRLSTGADPNNRNSAFVLGGPGGASRDAVVGLARFTEEITRMPLLQIEQDRSRVRILREDDYTLQCEYYDLQYVTANNAFGSELCGWNGEQLVFRTNLQDGLSIFHQVTLGPGGLDLNITTTVTSSQVSSALTISNYYRRYQPPETDIDCILTLTLNNVCRRTGN